MSDYDHVSQYLSNGIGEELDSDLEFQPCSIMLADGNFIMGWTHATKDNNLYVKAGIYVQRYPLEEGEVYTYSTSLNSMSNDYIQRINMSQVLTVGVLSDEYYELYEEMNDNIQSQRAEEAREKRVRDQVREIEEAANVIPFDNRKTYH